MISSARCCKDNDTSSANALAVLRVRISSNLVGCSTGRSVGFSPLRIRQQPNTPWPRRPSPMARLLLDRLRVDRRAGAAGDYQRRAAEEEFVDSVGGAIVGQVLEIEHLAHGQAHGGNDHPVPGLVGLGGIIGPHLDPPGVGADRGDLLFLAPVAVLELHAGRVAARKASPLLFLEAALHLTGAEDDEIAAANLDVLRLGALVEIVVGYSVAVLEMRDALEAGDVEQHAAPDHPALGVLDAELAQAVAIDQAGVEAVVHLVFIEDVAERVPMGGALYRH